MGIIDSFKNKFGGKPAKIGDLDEYASLKPSPAPQKNPLAPALFTSEIEIIPEYQLVKDLIEKGEKIVFVTGGAGTGKSTLIQYIQGAIAKRKALVAPTGVAALNIGGTTIHSFFLLPPHAITKHDVKKVRDRRLYEKLEFLIIDEISMVRADVLDGVDAFLRLNGKNPQEPFGGVQLLLVGDLFQLPPVVNEEERKALGEYKTPYFFSSKALKDSSFVPVELKKIYRQRDQSFSDLLNQIRVATNLELALQAVNSSCYNPMGGVERSITLTSTNYAADQINERNLKTLPGEIKTFKGEASGKFTLKDTRLPSPLNLQLKVGARVMFTKNDEGRARRWINGTLGTVKEFSEDSIMVEIPSGEKNEVFQVGKTKWESYKYEYNVGQDRIIPYAVGDYVQYPLMLAWAVTIHKGQGKTLENVLVDLGTGAFASGQVYVALSRCRNLKDISLARPINVSDVKCDEQIKRFYFALTESQKE